MSDASRCDFFFVFRWSPARDNRRDRGRRREWRCYKNGRLLFTCFYQNEALNQAKLAAQESRDIGREAVIEYEKLNGDKELIEGPERTA